ncbi:hypothetical protein D9758_007617 [Tetrapyrgos nigripes]|uniref:Major facilitator superfamily (MFS) profile domain-containing protein n=1 Tax=Tetrapyrgos nigripes TaxID=182062 RepID=A0A8H5G7W7_9AGAR|nr:hypothetical protein D9758_007617 [Tetrapyrgos nigripes]
MAHQKHDSYGTSDPSTRSSDTYDKPEDRQAALDAEKQPKEATPAPPESAGSSSDFPEGGLQAWLTVLGGWMITFVTAGCMQSFGVYQNYYTLVSLTDHPPSDISWIGSLQGGLMFGLPIISGQLFDKGYFRHLIGYGSLLQVFSSFMLSLVQPHHYYQNFLAQGVGSGIAFGMMFMPALSIPSHYFRKRRALAMGIVLSGGSVGSTIYPILLNKLFNDPSVGFAWGVRAQSFIELGFLAFANLVMRTRLPPRAKKNIDMLGIVTDWGYVLTGLGSFLIFWGLFVPYFYLQLFAAKHNMPANIVTYGITVLNALGILGRMLPNFFADIFGSFNATIAMSAICGGLVFALLGATKPEGYVPFAVLYGFTSGGFSSLIGPVAASYSRDVNEVGTRMGLVTFVSSFALLTGSPISGALLAAPEYLWWRPVVFSGVTMLSGSVLLLIARMRMAEKRGTWRV